MLRLAFMLPNHLSFLIELNRRENINIIILAIFLARFCISLHILKDNKAIIYKVYISTFTPIALYILYSIYYITTGKITSIKSCTIYLYLQYFNASWPIVLEKASNKVLGPLKTLYSIPFGHSKLYTVYLKFKSYYIEGLTLYHYASLVYIFGC